MQQYFPRNKDSDLSYVTSYHDPRQGGWVEAIHGRDGRVFVAGTQCYDTGQPALEIRYTAVTESSPGFSDLRGCVFKQHLPQLFELPYYYLVRTGVGNQIHYYPLPEVMRQVWRGDAPRWMRRKWREICKQFSFPEEV